jgi:hypothetical protein|tara:strand:- start:4211 stop:4774 length:564 start_codon:yes stop_codon:yes gene_type:complete
MANERQGFISRMWDMVLSDNTPSYTIKEVELKTSARQHMMENPQLFDRKLEQVSGETLLPIQQAKTFAMVRDPKTGTIVALDEEEKVIGASISTPQATTFPGAQPRAQLLIADLENARRDFIDQFNGQAMKIDTDTMNKIRYASGAVSLLPGASSFESVQEYLDDIVLRSLPERVEVEDPAENVEDE